MLRRNNSAHLTLQIEHRFGVDELRLDQEYTTYHGDKVTLTKFKYYLGNIELKQATGATWSDPNHYYVIDINDESASTFVIDLADIPAGEYNRLSFVVGVDSTNNHSGKQEGALDPDHGMFWMWETGYVFFKVEGRYISSHGGSGAMVYHIGRDECYRKIMLDLPQALKLSTANPTLVTITADSKKFFGGFAKASIDLKAESGKTSISVMSGEKAPKVANNFAGIFSIKE